MGIFFSKDKKSAIKRLKELEKKEGVCFSTPKLAKKQIKHGSGWKTWKTKEIKCKRK